ncbi:antibiotic biosynthesis monooxygenase family protein [Gangjinia marincola]
MKIKLLSLTLIATTLINAAGLMISSSPKATISTAGSHLTVVNVLSPKPEEQQKIVNLLQDGISTVISKQKGFISASIHKSMDSEHVVVYAQWKDQQALNNAVKLIEAGGAPSMLQVFSSANPDYHPYKVVSVNEFNKK